MTLENKIVALAEAVGSDVRDLREGKVDKVTGKGLSDTNFTQVEKTKLDGIASEATKNRADSLNADKAHTHSTAQVTGLDTALATKASKAELTAGLSLKVDTVTGKGLSDTNFTQVEKTKLDGIATGATKNRADTLNADKAHTHTTAQVTGLDDALESKVDKVAGKVLSDTNFTQAEKTKLSGIDTGATKNRADSANADKVHTHTTAQVTGLDTALGSKVDKEAGKGLSETDFTQAEKDKLSSLESSKFVGLFASDSALPTSGSAGDYADVDGGVGKDIYRVIWDSSDKKWVRVQGATGELTPAQIKQHYESNPDTNAFTDTQKTKLTGIATGATKNRADSANADKVHTHTTTQITGLDTTLGTKASKTELTDGLALKVDKVAGKGLSDTNFTQAEKTKLADVGDITRDFVEDYLLARG